MLDFMSSLLLFIMVVLLLYILAKTVAYMMDSLDDRD